MTFFCKSKRLFALLLALCMTLSCALALSACGGDTPGETKDTSDTSETGDPTPTWSDYGTTPLAPTGVTKGNFDRSKFHIGTYRFESGTRTEEMVKALSECGIDYIVTDWGFHNDLDVLWRCGVGVFTDEFATADHPACYAIDKVDEPSATAFSYWSEEAQQVNADYANQFPYINLFPAYARPDQLGTGYYADYIKQYAEKVPTDYICYDNYPYSLGDATSWYSNLKIVGDACTKNDRSLWVVAQGYGGATFEHDGGGTYNMTPERLRIQAYTAMAFGAETINWACWAAGWGDGFPEENGELTPLYDNWKEVNIEILGMADEFMKYRRMDTSFVGFNPNTRAGIDIYGMYDPVDVLNAGVFADFKINDTDKNLVVGEMAPRNGDGSSALMIAEATKFDGSNKASFEVTFKTVDSRTVKAHQGDTVTELTPDADGVYHLTVTPYAGILLVAERK